MLRHRVSLTEGLRKNGDYLISVLIGDCREVLKQIPNNSINCCLTSPPYYKQRNYHMEGQIGLEPTPEQYIHELVKVFDEIKRVLREDGVLFLNIGDTYGRNKQLLGIPWKVAFALQGNGWCLRQDIIWEKGNAVPESVKDRCTRSHEFVFLFSKSRKYYFDSESIKEPAKTKPTIRDKNAEGYHADYPSGERFSKGARIYGADGKRNKRDVWHINNQPYKGSHHAVMPKLLAEICIKAGCPYQGTVLDPFAGTGTTGEVCNELGRNAILVEINQNYKEQIEKRIILPGQLLTEVPVYL